MTNHHQKIGLRKISSPLVTTGMDDDIKEIHVILYRYLYPFLRIHVKVLVLSTLRFEFIRLVIF